MRLVFFSDYINPSLKPVLFRCFRSFKAVLKAGVFLGQNPLRSVKALIDSATLKATSQKKRAF